MRIKTLKALSRRLDAINTKTWPAGWVGVVPDEIAVEWIGEGVAIAVNPEPVTDATAPFTPDQAAVLAAAADQILAAAVTQNDEAAGGGVASGVSGASGEDDIALEDLTVAELKELATGAGLTGLDRMRKAELIAALSKLAA